MLDLGNLIVNGLRQPSFRGIFSSINVRNTYRTAALTTAVGALKLVELSEEVPLKSMIASPFSLSIMIEMFIHS